MATFIPPTRPPGAPPAGQGQPIQITGPVQLNAPAVVVQAQQVQQGQQGQQGQASQTIAAPPLAGTPGAVPGGLSGRAADLAQASRFAGMAGQGRTAALLGGASGVAAGAGPAGLAIEVVKQVVGQMEAVTVGTVRVLGDYSKAVASLDPEKMKDLAARWIEANAEAVGKVSPLAGVFAKAGAELVNQTNEVSRALTASAEHLSQFGGQLASTTADIEARRVVRDVRRADELGGPMSDFLQAQDRLDQALEKVQDRAVKVIAPILTNLLDKATVGVAVIENFLKAFIESVEALGALIPGGLPEAVQNALGLLRRLVENTDPAADPTDYAADLRAATDAANANLGAQLRARQAAEAERARQVDRRPLIPAGF